MNKTVERLSIVFSRIENVLRLLLFGGFFFLIFSFGTAIVPNDIFVRMTPVMTLDYVFLFLTSILFGAYLAIQHYPVKEEMKCSASAFGGGLLGFLGFGCSICNKLLVLLLGVTGVFTLFEPIKPLFGVLGVIFLSYAVSERVNKISLDALD